MRYNEVMILSFRHKGLEALYRTDSAEGVRPDHADKLRRILGVLDVAQGLDDMDVPGFKLHPLKHNRAGEWAVAVKNNWRVTFKPVGSDVELLDYEDYH